MYFKSLPIFKIMILFLQSNYKWRLSFIILSFIYLLFSASAYSQGTNCNNATPFCSNAALTFPNSTSTSVVNGPNYGCLNDPNLVGMSNPSWHYLNISQAGSLQITIDQTDSNNNGLDLDFAMWGPYSSTANGCAAIMGGTVPPIQCSSDPSNTETIGIGLPGGGNYWAGQYGSSIDGTSTPPPAQAGEFYIVVITNASNTSGNITFNQTGGTGSTNCAIVQPQTCNIDNLTATAVCSGSDATISGSLGVTTTITTGTLTITSSCGGSQTFNPPFPTTSTNLTYSFNGGPGDGSTCTVTAVFSDDPTCTATVSVTKPTCGGCTLTVNPTSATVCEGATTTITASETGGIWTTSDPAIATVNNGVVTGVMHGTANIIYTNGLCSDSTLITVDSIVNTTFTNLGPICAGANLPLPTTSTNGVSGTWSPAFDNTKTTTYTFTPNTGTCASTATMTVVVDDVVTPMFDNPGPICFNETFTLPTTSLNGVVGVWSPAIDNSRTTTYTFMPVSSSGCATPTTMTVVVHTLTTTSKVTATETTVTEGGSTNLNVTLTPYIPGITYSWSPTASLSCTNCPNPVATPTAATWYVVTMTTPEGCSFKDSIFIDYRIICGEVYVPNIFSPNQDGNNDYFKPYGRCLEQIQLSVYDRWGNKVFYTEDLTEGWDGTYKGKMMNTGTYVYQLTGKLIYGEMIDLKGNVTLTR